MSVHRSRRGPQPKEAIYRLQAEICRALGHPRRLAILDLLAGGEKSTAELLHVLRASKVNLSQHLAVMRHAGLVTVRQEGRNTFYRLSYPEITDACHLTRTVLARRLRQTSRLAEELGLGAGA
jgi:ArsR family transcriptional regulator